MSDTPELARPTTRVWMRLPLGRRGLVLAALSVTAAVAVLNWGWLTAVGLAPLILAVAPCAAMCALGLCMTGGSKSCPAKTNSARE
jgi:hypothetical protein